MKVKYDAAAVKDAARGRWREILSRLGNIPLEILDKKNHPCPRCGGKDRFRFTDIGGDGSAICSGCGLKSGDGIATLMWRTERGFLDSLTDIAEMLGVQPSAKGNGKLNRRGFASGQAIAELCEAKGIPDPAALVAYGAVEKNGRVLMPVFGYDQDTDSVRHTTNLSFDHPQSKGLLNKGQGSGLFLASIRPPKAGEVCLIAEGAKDSAALYYLGYTAVGLPSSQLARKFARLFAGAYVTVVPDCDTAGMDGARKTCQLLYGVAASVKIARLPGPIKESHGDDVRDVLRRDGAEAVHQAIAEASPWEPPAPSAEDELSLRWPSGQTEIANGKRLARRFGEVFRYVIGWDSPITYDGQAWVRDGARLQLEGWMKTIKESLAKSVMQFTKASSRTPAIGGAIQMSYSEPGIAISHELLDRDPMLLNVLDATIDLRTGTARQKDAGDYLTKLAPSQYDPTATCPRWEQFVAEVMAGDPELVEFLQRAVGYSLTGNTSERCLFFLWGTGRNGKTTFISTIQKLLGNYSDQITSEMLMIQRGQSHPTEMCDLHGLRLAVAAETEDGKRFAESLLKQLTGGEDVMKGRRMRQDFWTFRATHKLWLSGNHKPQIRGTDDAIWDRIRLIPFTVRFEQPDTELAAKLEAELPGILNWAIEGCLKWQQDGLGMPGAVRDAIGDYRSEQDVLGSYLTDACVIDHAAETRASELYAAYLKWCESTGEHHLSQRRFGMQLTERGFRREKVGGRIYWYGLALQAGDEWTQDHQDHQDQSSGSRARAGAGVESNAKSGPNGPNGPARQSQRCSARHPSVSKCDHLNPSSWVSAVNGSVVCPGCGKYMGQAHSALV